MSYRAGIGERLAATFGRAPCGPRIVCDGCGLVHDVYRPGGMGQPYAWFTGGRPVPGWTLRSLAGGGRLDYCPTCTKRRSE